MVLLYDDTVGAGCAHRAEERGPRSAGEGGGVRLERKPRNLKPLLEQLEASGIHRALASVTRDTVARRWTSSSGNLLAA